MQWQNTVEEVLCLSAQRGYTVFYRNCPDSHVLSDIVVAHPTSIQMMRTWTYVLIMDTMYNMSLLEAVAPMERTGNASVDVLDSRMDPLEEGVNRGGCGPIGLHGHRIMLYGGVRPPSGESGGARN
ncbi:hypothetical protein M9H77_01727 [Catharanthus roseus]|uniref:Uncharacterized protein n=1 Tax=Catharanthus roseus TaxID=4058 RepID=A0ACC0C6I2_CATRO|nr:hypothetical protein M9H77_01727 [Catharanthus roseus]